MTIKTHTPEKTTLVISTINKATYDMLAKGNPDALKIMKDEETLFQICFDEDLERGDIGKYGCVFNAVDRDGNLVCVLDTPEGEDTKQAVAELVLPAQMSLQTLEANVATAAAELKAAQTALKNTIVIA